MNKQKAERLLFELKECKSLHCGYVLDGAERDICIKALKNQLNGELIPIDSIVNFMINEFDETPCNLNSYDDYMFANHREYCENHCSDEDYKECWKRLLMSKLREVSKDE